MTARGHLDAIDCPNPLHDHPLPGGYNAAAEAAAYRLRHGWRNPRCLDCGLYGWRPPTPTVRAVESALGGAK